MGKPTLAIYWAGSCGGCDIAILDIEAHLLDVAAAFDIVLWPAATDFKYADVERLPDGSIDLCLFNGAIRTSENAHLAELLRRKSKLLVAFGSCAHEGCVLGLANLFPRDAILARAFRETPSVDNPAGVLPRARVAVPEGDLELPDFLERLRTLDEVVDVDYTIPGCPPQPHQIWAVLETIVQGRPLPPKGSIIGAGEKTCCEECSLAREEKKLRRFVRRHEIIPEPGRCLLDQGVVCLGPATRSGCGALCPKVGMPCRGCYGPPPNVRDQGAKMVSALASVIDSQDPDEVERIVGELDDVVGTLYRFSYAAHHGAGEDWRADG
jgi:F420-non-reducing hydrogenase small subunit